MLCFATILIVIIRNDFSYTLIRGNVGYVFNTEFNTLSALLRFDIFP